MFYPTGTENFQVDSSPGMINVAEVHGPAAASEPITSTQLIDEILAVEDGAHSSEKCDLGWSQSIPIPAPQPQPAAVLYAQSAPLPPMESIIASIASSLAQSCPPAYSLTPTHQVPNENRSWRQRTDSFTSVIPDDISTVTSSSLEETFSPLEEFCSSEAFAFAASQVAAPATQSCDSTAVTLAGASPPTVPDNADPLLFDELFIGAMFPVDSLVKVKPELLSPPPQLQRSYESHLNFMPPSTGDTSITISRQPPTVKHAKDGFPILISFLLKGVQSKIPDRNS